VRHDLTVVIPTISRPTLARAILSVRGQSVPTEFIVQPSTTDHCGDTQNAGVARVTTEWVGFLHDDDRLDWRYHEWFDTELQPGTDLFVFCMQFAPGNVLPTKPDPRSWKCGDVGISFVMRTSLCRAIGFRTQSCEDWLMIEAVRQLGYWIQVSQRVGYFVRS
jgi:hypothetical protein